MRKFRLLALLLLVAVVALGASWFYQFYFVEDACYDAGGYMENGQCVTAESCRAAGGSVETGKCVGARFQSH